MTILRSPTHALRRAWPLYLAGLPGLFGASLPQRYVELRDLTVSYSLPADVLRFLDTAAVDAALQQLSVARPTYAAWMLALEIAFAAVWMAMAVPIFRRHGNPLTGLIAGGILATFGIRALPALEALAVAAPAWHLLTAVLASVYTASIRLFQGVFVAPTGNRCDAAIVRTTLVVAAAATPARNALQVWIDRHLREPFDPAARWCSTGTASCSRPPPRPPGAACRTCRSRSSGRARRSVCSCSARPSPAPCGRRTSSRCWPTAPPASPALRPSSATAVERPADARPR